MAQQQADPLRQARKTQVPSLRNAQSSDRTTPDAPIVSDGQFEAALPPVDADINAPLPPINQTVLPPLAALALPDPALAEPLPALSSFDVTPPPVPTANAIATTPERAPTIRYSVAVEGLKPLNLETRFRSLSALDKGGGKAASGAVIAARATEDENLALRLLKSEGYYDAVVTSLVEPVAGQTDQIRATISVAPGPRYKLGTISITGAVTTPPDAARSALQLQTGDPIVAPLIEGAEAAVSLKLPQHGYPFVTLGQRDILLDERSATGDYTLPVDPGPRSSFGGVINVGDAVFAPDHVTLLARFKQGEVYDSRRIEDLREAMVATSLLSSVAIQPVRTGAVLPDGTERVDLEVRQIKGPSRTLAASLGYGTGEGFKVQGGWTHRNLFPPEGALSATAVLGSQQQSIGGSFRRSNAGQRDRTVVLNAQVSHDTFAAYKAYTATFSGRISRDSTPIWQKRWTYNYGFELTGTDERRADPSRRRDDGTYLIAALPGELGYDRSDNILNPTAVFGFWGA